MKCIVRVSSRRRERTYNDGTRNEILGVINLMYRSSRDVICFEMWHRLDIYRKLQKKQFAKSNGRVVQWTEEEKGEGERERERIVAEQR